MSPVTPSLAPAVQSSHASLSSSDPGIALNNPGSMFDWSKGSATKNAARITANSLPKLEAVVTRVEIARQTRSTKDSLTAADLLTKARSLLDSARRCQTKVPELLAKEAKALNAFEFAKLMIAVEERGGVWTEEQRFYVFSYASGSVGSVWLNGIEVYNSIWKNY